MINLDDDDDDDDSNSDSVMDDVHDGAVAKETVVRVKGPLGVTKIRRLMARRMKELATKMGVARLDHACAYDQVEGGGCRAWQM